MTLLRDTLTGIIGAFNSAHTLHAVAFVVKHHEGRASFELADYLPEGAHSIIVSSLAPRNDAVTLKWSLDGSELRVALTSSGRHYTPQPWDALETPVTLDAVIAYVPAPLDVPDLDLDGLHHYAVDLPAGTEHVVAHNMGKTRFIERITDADGRAQFASVEAMDTNRVRVLLAEALPVRLDMIFMPDSSGEGA